MLQQNEEAFLQMICGEAAQQRAAAYAQQQASPQGSPTTETTASGPPPKVYAIPTRVAKSVFMMMQNIAIATKCLGPSGKTGFKPKLMPAKPVPSNGSTSGMSVASNSVVCPMTPGGPPASTNTSARKLPPTLMPRKSSADTGSVVSLPAIKSAQASPRVPAVLGR
ncbi:Hypothetical protein, putative [Bodo saltans]|uniref:Uncharacterized protein n=1 Tax=Bodo saltans TaxID=75058 RepID=A0A0S4J1Q9_BODSA|nr:Hypothetical protein, putative [Bodo saltans]|eukprot:CUG51800.1 Hypothetical protein, putative [Bodo saltans]